MKKLSLLLTVLLTGCVGIPEGVKPVDNFDVQRYLGKWYEIARLDHSFERGLTHVSAEYALREDGGLKVINRGYSAKDNKSKEAIGKAYFVEDPTKGYLKVSFFGPFYGSYVIIDLDKDQYQYSLVCGPDRSYLWILSRTPTMQPEVKSSLISKAAVLGFDTSRLINVIQE
ncbi:lipocalin family protein [Geomonas sp. Red69]|uniref:Lipocalin family protein n=1 Tax=Geomonas diazotrophica TaxID=2843197 RepID=A0ABX8JJB1_9BACT|nr:MULTISPECIES: lipocalin family protein [Geomonas]MBU5636716.1 lipocalin family protein [Geomonas diazotrophica]QWV98468.1 lipocalin family protein [Geomonas nitrogeniifigens]QXE87651.1 lipocalin family protein [Geomonas nitrogeniifigens]